MARPYDVFLCYVWEDREQADLLRAALTDLGLDVFQDTNMRAYDYISGETERALRRSRTVVGQDFQTVAAAIAANVRSITDTDDRLLGDAPEPGGRGDRAEWCGQDGFRRAVHPVVRPGPSTNGSPESAPGNDEPPGPAAPTSHDRKAQ